MSPRISLGTSFYIARILDSHGAKRAHHRIVNFHKVKNVINRRATKKRRHIERSNRFLLVPAEWNETNINNSGPCRPCVRVR